MPPKVRSVRPDPAGWIVYLPALAVALLAWGFYSGSPRIGAIGLALFATTIVMDVILLAVMQVRARQFSLWYSLLALTTTVLGAIILFVGMWWFGSAHTKAIVEDTFFTPPPMRIIVQERSDPPSRFEILFREWVIDPIRSLSNPG